MKKWKISAGILSTILCCSLFAVGLAPVFADSDVEMISEVSEDAQDVLSNHAVVLTAEEDDVESDDVNTDTENPDEDTSGDEIPALQDKVIYQKNLVRFVTVWNEASGYGAEFKVQENDEYPISEGCMDSASYKMISDGFEEQQDGVAVWDVLYKDDAKMLHTLPELVSNSNDAFLGWVDADGEAITTKTPVTGGTTYYALFESDIVNQNMETGILEEDENKLYVNSAEVIFMIMEGAGEVKGSFTKLEELKREGINYIRQTADEISVKVSYEKSEDGTKIGMFPEVVPADGYELSCWTVTQVGVNTPEQATSSIRMVSENEPVYDGMVAVAHFTEIEEEPDDVISGDGTPDDTETPGTDDKKDDIHGDITVDNTNDSDNSGNKDNTSDTNNNANTSDSTENEESKTILYLLHVTDAAGSLKEVKVQSNKTVSELAQALGYTSVSCFSIKQANITEYKINSDMTMASIVELFKNGDIQVISYDSTDTAIGCAVAKETDKEYEYDVLLSKDTNVALRSASEIKDGNINTDVDGKGKDSEEVSKEGKSDSTAPSVKTGDFSSWMIYLVIGIFGLLVIAGGGGYLFYSKMKNGFDEL